MMDFTGKVALVTGASRGIGRAIAQQYSERGANVAIHYNNNEGEAERTLTSMNQGFHHLFQADLGEPDAAGQLIEAVEEEMGQVDILVNNAGIFQDHPLLEVEFDRWQNAWERILAINLLGPAHLIYWTAQHMSKRGGGRIINVSSRGAFRGEPTAPAYGASKAGLNAMSQSLAKALAPHNIFICVVAPGWVDTDMASRSLSGPEGVDIRAQSPLNRVATADEVARTVLFLSSEGTDFLTGCIVDVNGASYLRT